MKFTIATVALLQFATSAFAAAIAAPQYAEAQQLEDRDYGNVAPGTTKWYTKVVSLP